MRFSLSHGGLFLSLPPSSHRSTERPVRLDGSHHVGYVCTLILMEFCGALMQALPRTLVHLSISRNALGSLAGIEGLASLQWLDASCNQVRVSDLHPLRSMTQATTALPRSTGSFSLLRPMTHCWSSHGTPCDNSTLVSILKLSCCRWQLHELIYSWIWVSCELSPVFAPATINTSANVPCLVQSALPLGACRRLRHVDLAYNLLNSTAGLEGSPPLVPPKNQGRTATHT